MTAQPITNPIDVTDDATEALDHSDITSFKKKSISGAISYTVRSLALYGVGLATSLILGGYLSVEEFAVYGIVTQVVGILQFFSDVGLGPALIQMKEAPTLKQYRLVFTVQQALSWLIFAIIAGIVFSGVLDQKIGSAGNWILLSLGFSFPLSSLKIIPAIKLERKLDFSKLVIPNIFEQLVYSILLVWLVIGGYGVISYAYAIAARAIVGVIAMYSLVRWPIGVSFDLEEFKTVIGTGVKFQLSDFLARIKDNLFYLILGLWLPSTQYGYIIWSKSWSQVPYMLTVQNVIAITFPAYSRLQSDKKLLGKAIDKTIFFITASIFPVLVGMIVFIYPFTELVPSYHKWQPTLITFTLFTLSIAWAAVSTPLTNTLNAIGKINDTLKLMIMWTALTWILTPILVFQFGFNGVALAAFLISFTSLAPIYIVRQHVNLHIWDNTWRQLLAATIMVVVGYFTQDIWSQSFSWLFLGMMTVGTTYLASLLVFGLPKLQRELNSLKTP